jgi:dTDP-4-dehydrorhamnose reductase
MRSRVLVTGATGLLGRAIVREARADHDVVAMVHRRELHLDGVEQVRTDVRDLDALRDTLERVAPDLVVNTAALVRPDDCEADGRLTERLNVEVPATLADALRGTGSRLVHISSDAVYGSARPPFDEATRPEPESAYAASKVRSEEAVLSRFPAALVLRTNFFGWSATGQRSLAEFFLNALRDGRPAPGFTDVEFTPLYTGDLAALLMRAVETGVSGVRNLGSSRPLSKYEFGRQVAAVFGLDPEMVEPVSRHDVGLSATRSPVLSLDSSRIAAELGTTLPTVLSGLTRMKDDGRSGTPSSRTLLPTTARSIA